MTYNEFKEKNASYGFNSTCLFFTEYDNLQKLGCSEYTIYSIECDLQAGFTFAEALHFHLNKESKL